MDFYKNFTDSDVKKMIYNDERETNNDNILQILSLTNNNIQCCNKKHGISINLGNFLVMNY